MFRRRAPDPARVVDDLRATIARLDAQRLAAAEASARVFASQAQVAQSCDSQLAALAAAFGEAEDGETRASAGARAARRAGEPAELYEQTAAALKTSQDVLGAAAEPLHALRADTRASSERAREVLARAGAVLDEQLRAQIRALQQFERAEVARQAAAHRKRR